VITARIVCVTDGGAKSFPQMARIDNVDGLPRISLLIDRGDLDYRQERFGLDGGPQHSLGHHRALALSDPG
jgi:hypothetical protein